MLGTVAVPFLHRLAAEGEKPVLPFSAGVVLASPDRQHDDRGAGGGWLTGLHGDFLGVGLDMRITIAQSKFPVSNPPPN
jgi:hypothetical protein